MPHNYDFHWYMLIPSSRNMLNLFFIAVSSHKYVLHSCFDQSDLIIYLSYEDYIQPKATSSFPLIFYDIQSDND